MENYSFSEILERMDFTRVIKLTEFRVPMR